MKKLSILFMIVSLAALIGFTACDLDIIHSKDGVALEGITVPGGSLEGKIDWVKTKGKTGGTYTIMVNGEEEVGPQSLSGSGFPANVTINIVGFNGTIKLDDTKTGSLFTVPSGVTLKLHDITLEGHSTNYSPLVYVNNGGKLEITDATISGNTNTSYYGGGVRVASGGIFNMYSGEISGNKAIGTGNGYGGGVYVGGTFNMYGGEISGNTASQNGGGVCLYEGIFRIENGTIADDNIASGTPTAGSVFYGSNGAQGEYGTFTNGIWIKNGDIDTTNDAIEIVNGQQYP